MKSHTVVNRKLYSRNITLIFFYKKMSPSVFYFVRILNFLSLDICCMNYQITFIKITTQEYGILLGNNFYRFRVKRTNFITYLESY